MMSFRASERKCEFSLEKKHLCSTQKFISSWSLIVAVKGAILSYIDFMVAVTLLSLLINVYEFCCFLFFKPF
jgi:hypothetical protein